MTLRRRMIVAAVAVLVVVAGALVLLARDPQPSASGAADTPTGSTEPESSSRLGPYNPKDPVDLSGVVGVSAEDQAAAEQLLTQVQQQLPAFADVADAEAAGYRSIGDAFTGQEHLINSELLANDTLADPNEPEALVYDVADDGTRTLIAAMFMGAPGLRLIDVPAVGGALTPWHLHRALCGPAGANAPIEVLGITDVDGTCPAGQVELDPVPTLHVWGVAHPCGPFAELEGVGTSGRTDIAGACVHRHG